MRSKLSIWLALVALFLIPALAGAQDTTAKIHGHVQDPANAPIANGQVILSTDGKTALYTFTTDASGDYKGEGIKPGTYYVTLDATPGKAVDRFDNVKFTAGTDTPQDFDLSRAEYVNKLPPDQRKALEEAKTKNAEINKENQSVGKLNDLLKQAHCQRSQIIRRRRHRDAAGHNHKAGRCRVVAGTGHCPDRTEEVRRRHDFTQEGSGSRCCLQEAQS
jgi:hypothetical protein